MSIVSGRIALFVTAAVLGVAIIVGCSPAPPPPAPDQPATEQPVADEPVAEAPAVEEPKADEPAKEEAAKEEPAKEEPKKETPAKKKPAPAAAAPLKKSEVLGQLPPDICNTSDGMALLPDGNIVISVPNFNDDKQSAVLMKITPENKAELFSTLPPHPKTGKFGPLGICVAPSGDLYVADYQMSGPHLSRVMRIVMKDGKPGEMVTVVSGFNVSNAVIVRDGYLYVSETQIDPKAKPATSGVFRFKLGEEGVELKKPGSEDPHLIATIATHDETLPLGADGLAFDSKGNLFVANFSDGTVHKLEFDKDGKVKSNTIFAKADCMKCADGLFLDPTGDNIYVADSRANAVHMISPDGSVQTVAQNGDTDGTDGGMDQPCEVLIRGREIIVSNMDWPVPGCVNKKYDKPCVVTVIKLD